MPWPKCGVVETYKMVKTFKSTFQIIDRIVSNLRETVDKKIIEKTKPY